MGAVVAFLLNSWLNERSLLKQRVDRLVDERIQTLENLHRDHVESFAKFEASFRVELLGLADRDEDHEKALQELRVDFRQLECAATRGRWIINSKECAPSTP